MSSHVSNQTIYYIDQHHHHRHHSYFYIIFYYYSFAVTLNWLALHYITIQCTVANIPNIPRETPTSLILMTTEIHRSTPTWLSNGLFFKGTKFSKIKSKGHTHHKEGLLIFFLYLCSKQNYKLTIKNAACNNVHTQCNESQIKNVKWSSRQHQSTA